MVACRYGSEPGLPRSPSTSPKISRDRSVPADGIPLMIGVAPIVVGAAPVLTFAFPVGDFDEENWGNTQDNWSDHDRNAVSGY